MPKFEKSERLCSKLAIENTFLKGESFYNFPLKVIYLKTDKKLNESQVQAAFVVPKRIFKKAVDRNRIKRQMKEAYRLNKETLYRALEGKNIKLNILIIYNTKNISTYWTLNKKIKVILQQLIDRLNKSQDLSDDNN